MAFSNIENSESLGIINIAIVDNEDFKNNEIFKETFKNLSDENNKDRLFNTKYVTEENAKELLENDEIIGYLKIEEDDPKVIVTTSGINETVFKYVVEEITQTTEIVKNTAQNKIKEEMLAGNYNVDYEKIYENIIENVQNQEVKLKNISNSNLSYTMIEFYTLIAMACLYGGTLGMTSINQNLANMSNKGKRVAVSPVSKLKVVCSSVLASYIAALIGLLLLFIFFFNILFLPLSAPLLLTISSTVSLSSIPPISIHSSSINFFSLHTEDFFICFHHLPFLLLHLTQTYLQYHLLYHLGLHGQRFSLLIHLYSRSYP